MFEIKAVRLATKLYRGIVALGLRSVNARDKTALHKLNVNLVHAEDMRETARELISRAEKVEDKAHDTYTDQARVINSAYNLLSNLQDDIPTV